MNGVATVTAVEGPLLATTPVTPGRLRRLRGVLGPGPVPWGTVLTMAVLLSVIDSFVANVVQGAVGSVERAGESFRSWMVMSVVTLPLFVLAVLGALAVARRRFGHELHTPKKVVATALLIAFAGTVLGSAVVVANTAYDYHLQSQEIRATVASHGHAHHGLSVEEQLAQTLSADEAGARDGGRLIVMADLVIVAWVTAMRGGRLDVTRRPRSS